MNFRNRLMNSYVNKIKQIVFKIFSPFSYLMSVLSELVGKGLGDSDLNKEQGPPGRQCRTGWKALAPHWWRQPLQHDGSPGWPWLPERQSTSNHCSGLSHHLWVVCHYLQCMTLSTNVQPSNFHEESCSKQYIIVLFCLKSELWSLVTILSFHWCLSDPTCFIIAACFSGIHGSWLPWENVQNYAGSGKMKEKL